MHIKLKYIKLRLKKLVFYKVVSYHHSNNDHIKA